MTAMKKPDSPEVIPVHVAIARIIAELPAIGKDDRMSGGGISYNYRGIEAITSHVKPLLARHGVVIVPRAQVTDWRLAPYSEPGTPDPKAYAKAQQQDLTLTINWLIVGPDGSTLEATTVGVGRDSSDKTATKSATQAYKYLLLHLFCIADGADDADGQQPDGGSGDDERQQHDPSAEQAVAARISNLSGADKALVTKKAKEAGINNVMRSGDRAEEMHKIIDALFDAPVESGDAKP